MPIAESLLPEFDLEMENTRRILERIPTDDFDWKPHDKSFTLGKLATHVAALPGWAAMTFTTDELDIAPVGGEPMQQPQCHSTQDLLDQLSRDSAAGRKALLSMSDTDLMKPWSLKAGGKEIMTMPKVAIYRGMIMNHLIHHRAQITVYLRLRGVPLPAMYGPTADEPGAFGPPA
ncbi:MAG TPA: DinB family protein [Gemmatimonadaceae bacterium]|nr:DinB family protein [Gemmatimonadaceae bacterium]